MDKKRLDLELDAIETKDIPLNLGAFKLGKKYFESAIVLEDHIRTTNNANVAPGLVTCLLISMELLLKSIVLIDTDFMSMKELSTEQKKLLTEHKPNKLFDQISDKNKDFIAKYLCAETGEHYDSTILRRKLKREYENSFVKWRYAHEFEERNYMDTNFVKALARALVSAGVEIKA